jgi:hypothetical protein
MNHLQIAASAPALGLLLLSIRALPNVNNFTMIDATDSYDLATASALLGRNSFTTAWRDSW